jgi:HYR domain
VGSNFRRKKDGTEQVINIINNVTTNGTGTTTPPPPPPPPPMGNGTGNGTGGGVGPRPPGGGAGGIPENATITADITPPVLDVPPITGTYTASNQEGIPLTWVIGAEDNVDGLAILNTENRLIQDPIVDTGGDITISCNPPSGSIFTIGVTTVQCTATDASGNTRTASWTVNVNRPPIESPFLAQEQEQPPAAEEEQPPVEEEGATTPPANDGGGGGG